MNSLIKDLAADLSMVVNIATSTFIRSEIGIEWPRKIACRAWYSHKGTGHSAYQRVSLFVRKPPKNPKCRVALLDW